MLNGWTIPRGIAFRNLVIGGSNTATPVKGAWLSLANNLSWQIVLTYAAGVIPPEIALQQATDSAGAGATVLKITDITEISATDTNAPLDSEVNYHNEIHRTNVDGSDASVATFDSSAFDGAVNKQYQVVIRVDAGTMTTGFTHIRVVSTGTSTPRAFNAVAIGLNKGSTATI